MAIKPDWTLGTLTLTAGSTAFTTTGSALKAADIQGGDTLMTQSGAVLVIETITGENSGTLYMPCPASAAGYDQPLRVRYQGDASRLPAATRDLVNMLTSGNLSEFSQLQGDIDKVPYFLAPGVLGLIDLSSLGGGGTGKGAWNALVGTLAGRAAYNNEAEGFRVLVADNGNGQAVIYQKTGAGTVDWSMPIPFTGAKGNDGQPNKLTVGSVIEGDETRVTITGTPPNQFVNFVLRRGVKGDTGDVTPEALGAKKAAEAAAEKTASDVVITGKDVEATAADRIATGKDAEATAADRIVTGKDAEATAADVVATGQDVEATAADRIATGKDVEATAADRIATGKDVDATAADRIATGKDAEATASDVVATGRDVETVTQAKEAVLRSESQAQEWANAPEGEEVKPGEFSARHWAKKAEHSAGGGVQSINNKTEAHIVLDAADVGAAPDTIVADVEANKEVRHDHTNKDVLDQTTAAFLVADREKFDAIEENATANDTNAQLRDRGTHTGEQSKSTITGLVDDLSDLDTRLNAGGSAIAALGTKLNTVEEGAQVNPNMGLYQSRSEKNVANGYAGLDANGKLDENQLPAIAITDTFVVATEAAMLALNVQRGDIAVRTDLNKTFIVRQEPATLIGNWQELRTPTDAVLSVVGLTGAITQAALRAALGLGSAAYSAVGDFATSAEGALARSAMQPEAMTGYYSKSEIDQLLSAYAKKDNPTFTGIVKVNGSLEATGNIESKGQ